MTGQLGDRALVLGGSIAGLLAARVLSEAYRDVLVVDRDTVLGVSTPRRGVPQGPHVHGLLARGQQILEELFPSFTQEAVENGVPTGDLGTLRWFFNGRPLRPGSTGLVCVSATRPVLENHIRKRTAALPNVQLIENCDVLELIASPDQTRITGARVQRQGEAPEEIEADLVVDATGRGSRTPAWLAELGYSRPEEDRVRIDLTYTSRIYRKVDDGALNGDLSINPVSSPSHPRGAFLSQIENGRCIVSATGVLGDRAPTDPDGYLEFIRSLPVPDVYQVIRDAEPETDPVAFRFPVSIRRRYERLERFPERFLVIGDAACSFNPVYGQGMTVAALEAMTLRRLLQEGSVPSSQRWLREIATVIDTPWEISAGGDLAFAEVVGKRTAKTRVMNGYMARLQAAATLDGEVTRTFMRVAGLVDPPQALMRPGMVYRVLRNSRRARTENTPAT
jgi:2-polyprenyl-6-methoxyphenol hydroxylase-like FAD-dependent oxidoreductase